MDASVWRRIAFCLLTLGIAPFPFLYAQKPPAVEPKNLDFYEHKLGPYTAVHLTKAEYEQAKDSYTYFLHDTVEFEIVVSENGTVESAKLIGEAPYHLDDARAIEMARTFKPWTENGKSLRVTFHDYVSILPPEQWAETHVPFPEIKDLTTVSIGLKRTRCYGTCPAYTVTISSDGTVRYAGRSSVVIPGDHIAHISPDAVRDLLAQFRKADFFSAKDKYVASVTDNPTTTITLTIGPQTKTVVDYVGLRAGIPMAISGLESQIDEAAGTARWVKTNDQTLPALLEEKWAFNASTPQNLALYSSAIEHKNTSLIEQFIASGGPIIAPPGDDASPVCTATATGYISLVRRMAEHTKTFPPRVLNQCLSTAARSGNLALLQFWLDKGADPTAKPEKVASDWMSNLGPLPNALIGGNADVVRTLLTYKLDVHSNVQENTPLLRWALRGKRENIAEIVTLLAAAGADVNVRGNMGQTPIFDACFDKTEAIKPLLAAGADIEARDNNGDTPLIRYSFMEPAVRELLADGADPTAVAKNGDTALKTARQYGCPTCATLIEAALKQRALLKENQ